MTDTAASKPGRRSATLVRRLRRTALVLLLGLGVAALWPEPPMVPRQEVAHGVVVTLLEPMRLADARVGLYLLLVGLAVLPDALAKAARRRSQRFAVRALAAEAGTLRAELAAIRKEADALTELLTAS